MPRSNLRADARPPQRTAALLPPMTALLLFLSVSCLFSASPAWSKRLGGGAGLYSETGAITSDPGVYPGGNENPRGGWSILPQVSGARIDNTTIKVGRGGATLTNYITESFDPTVVKRAVIQIHGENRDSWNQWLYADLALDRAIRGGEVKREEVVIMAPQFFQALDVGAFAADAQGASITNTLVWPIGTSWGDGSVALYPNGTAGGRSVGGFDALDAAVSYFTNRDDFPNLETVVVAGFSLGGQLAHRYSVLRKDTSQDDRIHYWISSPNSFLYLNSSRPNTVGKECKETYNNYKYGLAANLPPYVNSTASPVSNLKSTDLIATFLSRRVIYMVGSQDKMAGFSDCPSDSQGTTHVRKMKYWTEQVVPYLPGSTMDGTLPATHSVHYISRTGHQDWKVITSDSGVLTLFLENYNGDGTTAAAPPSNGVPDTSPKGGEVESSSAAQASSAFNDRIATTLRLGLALAAVAAMDVL